MIQPREVRTVNADHFNIDMSGALIFTNGDVTDWRLVCAFAPGEWIELEPVEEDECTCDTGLCSCEADAK